jgi:SAM-dependent MidA family methyltransferase
MTPNTLDFEKSYEINKSYYTKNVEVKFLTEAMRREYPEAFGKLLFYNYYNMLDDELEVYSLFSAKKEKIRILDVGARGVYFERNLFDAISNLEKENIELRDRIEYTILDISAPAIKYAQEEYNAYKGYFFKTNFIVADVLSKEEMSQIGRYDIIILNELLDDLPQMVITKSNGKFYEVLFKPVFDIDNNIIKLEKNGIKEIEIENVEGFVEYEKEYSLKDGEAVTYSPSFYSLVESLKKHLNQDGFIFIHDYVIRGPVSYNYSQNLKRVYGSRNPITAKLLEENPYNAEVQITADVNLMQLNYVLEKNEFSYLNVPHKVFLNDMLGNKRFSLQEIAFSLNRLDEIELKELLKKLGRDMEDFKNASLKEVKRQVVKEVNNVIKESNQVPGLIVLRKGFFYGTQHVLDMGKIMDKENAKALYHICRNKYGVKNPYLNVIARY